MRPPQAFGVVKKSLVASCLAICLFAVAPALARQPRAPQPDIPALCKRALPAFVFIEGGSGVVVSPDGWMLTNNHVVGNRKQFDVRTGDGRHYHAKVLGRDVSGDLAVLQLEFKPKETVPYLDLGDSEAMRVGDSALAVGNPFAEGLFDEHPTFTLGVISALHQTIDADADALATDAAMNPGNSGGPLINMAGQVVGINGQIATRWGLKSSTGLGYALSARQIRLWLPRLVKANGGVLAHGRLSGVDFENTDEVLAEVPKISDVVHDSPADKAGLKVGDRITRFDGQPIASAVQLAQVMCIYPQDQEVAIGVQRDGKEVALKVNLPALKHGKLGIELARPGKNDEYIRVGALAKDSPAQQAGLKSGDEIVAIERIELKLLPVQTQYERLTLWLKRAVYAGEATHITIRRKGADGKMTTEELRLVAK